MLKSGWFWASAIVVAITAAIVMNSAQQAPPVEVELTADALPEAESVAVSAAAVEPAAPLADAAPPDDTEVAIPHADPEPVVEIVENADTATPLTAITPSSSPAENENMAPMVSDEPAEAPEPANTLATSDTPTPAVAVESPAEPNETPAGDAAAEILPDPQDLADATPMAVAPTAQEDIGAAMPNQPVDSDVGVHVQADSAVSKPVPTAIAAAPEAILPAPELSGNLEGIVEPHVSTEASGAPDAIAPPALGAASQPLSLAQVLLPGEAPSPGQIAPSFDLVRVAPDGSTVIAGRAEPGANVQVFSGTVPVAEVTASARGEFVVFLDGPTEPSLDMNIPATPEGAQLVVSQDDIIILPAQPDAPEASPMVLRRTPDAVQIVQPSGPAIPGNISLDLVSYAESGAVQLAGRGQPGNTARIYTNDSLAGEATITAGGNWAHEIAELAKGRYILRVDEISPTGAVLSRTESPFQREFPEANLPGNFSQGAKIIVQPGNTLWLMATEAYGEGGAYTQIFSANSDAIRDPDLIYPGQIFSIPRDGE